MTGRMETFGLSDIGLVRERNEDQFLIADLKKSVVIHQTSLSYDDETPLMGASQAKLFLVADGISDSPAGERASRIAIQGIVQYLLNTMHWLFRTDDDREEMFLEDLKAAVTATQQKIQHAASLNPSQRESAASITMAYVVWPQAWLVHVGDSRAYLFRNQQLMRLTHDQASRQNLFDAGLMEEDSRKSPMQHVLSGLVGCHPGKLNPGISRLKLSMHDKLLLCTDGLTEQLSEPELSGLLSPKMSVCRICHQLVGAANDAGGSDNTTVVLAHFTDREFTDSMQMEEAICREDSVDRDREAAVQTCGAEISIAPGAD